MYDNLTFREFCGGHFFDLEETFGNLTGPNLSDCFRRTVLVWVPVLFLWATIAFPIYSFLTVKSLRLPWTFLLITKLCLQVVLILVTATEFVYAANASRRGDSGIYPVSYVAPLLLCLAMMTLLGLMVGCRQRGSITSGVIFLTFLLLAVCGAPEFGYQIDAAKATERSAHGTVQMVCYLIYYPLILLQLILSAFADRPAQYAAVGKGGEKPCPENYASFLNRITFSWFTGMSMVGWRRPLTNDDLWALNEDDSSKKLVKLWEKIWGKKMQRYWRKNEAANRKVETAQFQATPEEVRIVDGAAKTSSTQAKTKPVTKPSVVGALFLCFWPLFLPATIVKTIADILQFVSPQLLSALITFCADDNQPLWKGFAYATMMFVVALIYSILLHQYFHWMLRLGMNVRTVLISAIFTKCLRLSNSARRNSTVGEIVNLMSVDTQRFMDTASYINMLWSSPLQIAFSLYFLWQELGPAVLAGLGLMILLLPVNYYLSTIQRKYQFAQMKFKDDRIKLISEILNGVKVLKLYAWEKSFEKQVMGIRHEELKVLKKSAYFMAATTSIWTCAPFLVSIVSFACYVLVDPVNNVLTPQRAFVSLALFNILRFPMTVLPMFVSFMVQASVSNKRVKDFLSAEELDLGTVNKQGKQDEAVKIENGVFSWEKEGGAAKPALDDINVGVMPGQLVAVVGQVGSGKSSLLSAILGEMEKLRGEVSTRGQIAYVPQLAWIQNLTLRDNVTFSKSFDQAFYDRVISACTLEADFAVLPGGDSTEIGEKGINLSGGQKQRVSLARAVYQNADVYLLDDPLSAVDAHVGRHIFDNVISNDGLLKGKTRILVTHGLGYLKKVDNIIVIRDGRVTEMGTYAELLFRKGAFAELIATYLEKQAKEVTEEEVTPEDVSALEEVLEDLEKVDPNARARLVSQLSQQDDSAATKSPSPERSLQRMLTRQQSILAAITEGKTSPSSSVIGSGSPTSKHPSSPTRQFSRQITRQSARSGDIKSPLGLTKDGADVVIKPVIAGTKLIQEEQSETGNVKWKVYKDYFQALGWIRWVVIGLLYAVSNAFAVGTNVWLADWSSDKPPAGSTSSTNETKNETKIGPGSKYSLDTRLGVYAALGIAQTLFILFAALLASYSMVLAGGYLHSTLLRNLLRSPMSFFDVTPLGRIVNRVGKDVDTVDNTLPQNLRSWIGCVIQVVSTVVVIIASTPIFSVVVLPLGLLYYFVQRFYISTSRQLKRIESVSRSPIYSHFQETVTGAISIRAYSAQKRFVEESERRVDTNQAAYYPNLVSNRWLAIRLELVGNLIIFFAAVFAVTSRFWGQKTTAGMVGLSVSYALSVTQILNWAVRMTSDVEANIVAVERIKEYSETPTEAPWETDVKPPANWPQAGAVALDHYSLRYRPDMELVLKDVSCNVSGGERIGIVGRTGAGKSSLTLALFRIVEGVAGKIVIDNVDISKIGLHDLRSRLTIIPQDPVLFSGTLRMNLDPFEKHQDLELWTALEHSHLKDFVAQTPGKLMSPITEGGENLSVGQRQLLCLARALLRKTKVLVLDEATSAVDLETEDLILKTIRTHFADCTILTIAHRLNTIIDSNRVLVLSQGKVAEFDSPENLLGNTKTMFYEMAKDANIVKD